MKVIVVGAGLIGASIAYNLAQAGARVSVVTSGAAAATDASFGWINASFYADTAHHRLRVASMEAYARLMAAVPDLPIAMNGALWWEEQGAPLRKMQADLDALGYPVERVNREAAQAAEPDLKGLPEELLRFPDEGVAEVAALAQALLLASGAQIVSGVSVTGIAVKNGDVCGVKTQIGPMSADHVIVAAGNGAPEILASAEVALPMLVRPGAMVTTKPVAARISQVLVTPHGEVRQLPDGRILASAVANHQGDASSAVFEPAEDIATRVLAWLTPMIEGAALEWDRVSLAYRPVPQDGLPVIGAVGPRGLHVAVLHSGVTLAPIVGEAVANEVMGGGKAFRDLLAPYRPERFQ